MTPLYIETSRFRHPDFVRHEPDMCCRGEDFAAWLAARLRHLEAKGFRLGEPIQEDYGCGFWVHHGPAPFWIALSYAEGQEPVVGPAHWVVQVTYDPGANVFKKLFQRPDPVLQAELTRAVVDAIRSDDGIRVLTNEEWASLGEAPD